MQRKKTVDVMNEAGAKWHLKLHGLRWAKFRKWIYGKHQPVLEYPDGKIEGGYFVEDVERYVDWQLGKANEPSY